MKKPYLYSGLAAVVVVILIIIAGCQAREPARLTFFDVGQGDASLIQQGTNQILIDGGPSRAVIDKLGETMPYFDREIEVVVLTHADSDHFAGLIDVLDRYQVKTFVWTGALNQGKDFETFLDRLAAEGAAEEIANAGDQFEIGVVRLSVLYPLTENQFLSQHPKDLNDTSVVVRVDAPAVSVLLTGDAGFPEEKQLMSRGANLRADILKAGHHGSKNSTSAEWLKAVAPREVVFSVGEENRFGHPASETLQRVEAVGADIKRTDQSGDIKVDLE